MKLESQHNGFSLTEVLMAVGILSVGMMLVATMFPVGIYLTTAALERTMAAIVADEAFAKIQLYGLKTPPSNTNDYELAVNINSSELSYPSVDPATKTSQYYWSALYKRLSPTDTEYLITVFVARKTSPNLTYLYSTGFSDRPRVVDVNVQRIPGEPNDILRVLSGKARYVNPPTTILDSASGRLYRVVDREIPDSNKVKLDRVWDANTAAPNSIWLIPPPETGGKNADIEVFQRIIRF